MRTKLERFIDAACIVGVVYLLGVFSYVVAGEVSYHSKPARRAGCYTTDECLKARGM
jgi:hypothetical protein